MLCTDKVIGMVAAGQHAQTAAVAREWVEIERNLHRKELVPVAVGMPSGISAVVVSVSTGVVKVFSEDFVAQSDYPGIVEQSTQTRSMFNGSAEHSATRAVVPVAAAKVLDGILKLFANPSNLVW